MSTREQALWDKIHRTAEKHRMLAVAGTTSTVSIALVPYARSGLEHTLAFASRESQRTRVRECLAWLDEIEAIFRAGTARVNEPAP